MARIGNFYNNPGAVFEDRSQNVNVQVNAVQTVDEQPGTDEPEANQSRIELADGISKADFFRVIMALCKVGAFRSVGGGKAKIKDVFAAFGDMLGEDYSGYANHLSSDNYKINGVTIFNELEEAYNQYAQEKFDRLVQQGKRKGE